VRQLIWQIFPVAIKYLADFATICMAQVTE